MAALDTFEADVGGAEPRGIPPRLGGPTHERFQRLLQLVSAPPSPQPAESPGRGAPGVIETLRGSARYMRQLEDQAGRHGALVEQATERLRGELVAAVERARVAEARATAAETSAEARVLDATRRAEAAEERADRAEGWLAQIQETVRTEFAGLPG